MQGIRGRCKECGEELFVDSENCGTDESLCEVCVNYFLDMELELHENNTELLGGKS